MNAQPERRAQEHAPFCYCTEVAQSVSLTFFILSSAQSRSGKFLMRIGGARSRLKVTRASAAFGWGGGGGYPSCSSREALVNDSLLLGRRWAEKMESTIKRNYIDGLSHCIF